MEFATRFTPPSVAGLKCDPDTRMTRDEFAKDADINTILAKYKVTGVLVDPTIRRLQRPIFADVSDVPSLDEFEKLKESITDSFKALPEAVQEAFGGDPMLATTWLGKASRGQILALWRDCGLNPADDSAAVKANEERHIEKPVEKPAEKPAENPKT